MIYYQTPLQAPGVEPIQNVQLPVATLPHIVSNVPEKPKAKKEKTERGKNYFTAEVILKIGDLVADKRFQLADQKPNVRKIAEELGLEYFKLYRFLNNKYKEISSRADKGKSRKIISDYAPIVYDTFKQIFLSNAQQNVQLTKYRVEKELGIAVPHHLAYAWARELSGTHSYLHYRKDFQQNYFPRLRRDNWGEIENFLDVVIGDAHKIDFTYIQDSERDKINAELEELKRTDIKKWKSQRFKASTAYALCFMDQKTGYIVGYMICAHSVSGHDVKRLMAKVIKEYGLPKQWYLDNGSEFNNKDVFDFITGIYTHHARATNTGIYNPIVNAKPYSPQGKGKLERFFKTFKDELSSFQESYSPNPAQSRKPDLHLTSPAPVLTFRELAGKIHNWMEDEYNNRPRTIFYHPGYDHKHPININRPTTVTDAFTSAFSTYKPRVIDTEILAYHFAERIPVTLKNNMVKVKYGLVNLELIVDEIEKVAMYSHQTRALTLFLDPTNIYRGVLYSGYTKLTTCADMRAYEFTSSADKLNYINKIQSKVERYERKKSQLVRKRDEEMSDITPPQNAMDQNDSELSRSMFEEISVSNYEPDFYEEYSNAPTENTGINIFDIEEDE